jgi:hypothetical protein
MAAEIAGFLPSHSLVMHQTGAAVLETSPIQLCWLLLLLLLLLHRRGHAHQLQLLHWRWAEMQQ